MTYDDIRAAVEAQGFILRGGFHPVSEDEVPGISPETACETLVIIGNAGRDMWLRFRRSAEFQLDKDPLNAYSRRVINDLADEFGAAAMFPFTGPPFLPFIRWAQRAEPVWPSPIGPLIHPKYGLWHAYRGALGFPAHIALPPRGNATRPCDTCAEKPCLHACPVDAFSDRGYDVPACLTHLNGSDRAPCFDAGCLARCACPIGVEYAYVPAQARFHTRAFFNAGQARLNQTS